MFKWVIELAQMKVNRLKRGPNKQQSFKCEHRRKLRNFFKWVIDKPSLRIQGLLQSSNNIIRLREL